MTEDLRPPYRIAFDNARNPYAARNALGILTTGGGPPAPANAQYITAASDATLTAERVATNTATVTWDFATAGQAKANVVAGSFGDVYLAAANVFTNTNTFQGGGTVVQGTSGGLASFTMANFQAANGNPNLTIQHSRGTTLGSHAAVIAADRLGQISFQGSDGAAFAFGVTIQAYSEAVPTSGHIASNLRFATDNGTAFAERVRIWASGGVDFDQSAAADPGVGNIKVKGIKGVTNGSDAAAGVVGEYIETVGGSIAVGAFATTALVSMAFSAGDWDVWGVASFTSATLGSRFLLSHSNTTGLDTTIGRIVSNVVTPDGDCYVATPVVRQSLTGTTTLYMVAFNSGAGTINASKIMGRRRR